MGVGWQVTHHGDHGGQGGFIREPTTGLLRRWFFGALGLEIPHLHVSHINVFVSPDLFEDRRQQKFGRSVLQVEKTAS